MLCLGAGCAAGRHSAEAQLHGCPVPPGPPAALLLAGDTLGRDTSTSLVSAEGKRVVLLPPLKKGCARFNERNEWAPARSPLLESQLDSVP